MFRYRTLVLAVVLMAVTSWFLEQPTLAAVEPSRSLSLTVKVIPGDSIESTIFQVRVWAPQNYERPENVRFSLLAFDKKPKPRTYFSDEGVDPIFQTTRVDSLGVDHFQFTGADLACEFYDSKEAIPSLELLKSSTIIMSTYLANPNAEPFSRGSRELTVRSPRFKLSRR